MKLSIELSEAQAAKLREHAAELGVRPEQLAQAAVTDLLEVPNGDFRSVAEDVLRKNHELYRRLS